MKLNKTIRYIGVDPGTNVLGYAVIEIVQKQIRLVELDVLRMSKYDSPAAKLKAIFEGLQRIIIKYKPSEMAIEAPFYGKNVQSMLKLGRAQGVARAAAMTKGVEVTEYSPKRIKQAITGNGNATKEQVAAMLATLTSTKLDSYPLDATDALATAVCHYFQSTSKLKGGKKYKGWEGFLKDNPNRVG